MNIPNKRFDAVIALDFIEHLEKTRLRFFKQNRKNSQKENSHYGS